MNRSEIGDKAKLRRISDILLARGAQMLPSNVNTDEWQPVISYGIDVNDQSYFHLLDAAYSIAGVSSLTRSFGSAGATPTIGIPAGFLYKLVYIDWAITFGAAPLNDEKLRLNIQQVFANLSVGTRSVRILDMAPEDQQPYIRLRAAQTVYNITLPMASMGTVLPSGLEQIRHIEIPQMIIPVPESDSEPGASRIDHTVAYNATNGAGKNFPAGSVVTMQGFFKKEPVSNFNMDAV